MEEFDWSHLSSEVKIRKLPDMVILTIPWRKVQVQWNQWKNVIALFIFVGIIIAAAALQPAGFEAALMPLVLTTCGVLAVFIAVLWLFGKTTVTVTPQKLAFTTSNIPILFRTVFSAEDVRNLFVKSKSIWITDHEGGRRKRTKEAFALHVHRGNYREEICLSSHDAPLLLAVEIVVEDVLGIENELMEGWFDKNDLSMYENLMF